MCAQGAGSIFKKVKMKNNFETSKLSDRYPQTHLFTQKMIWGLSVVGRKYGVPKSLAGNMGLNYRALSIGKVTPDRYDVQMQVIRQNTLW